MRVAIVTDLRDFSSAYSVTHVVIEQERLFRAKGIHCEVMVPRICDTRAAPPDVVVSRVLAAVENGYYNQGEVAELGFQDKVKVLEQGDSTGLGYAAAVEGFDVVIVHDLLSSAWHLPQNLALRQLKTGRLLAWCHSMPQAREDVCVFPSILRFKAAPGWTYVYPSSTGASLAREHIEGAQTAVVYNPMDLRSFYDFSPQTCNLIDQLELFKHDFLQVYAFSMPRWRQKGVPALLKLFSKMRHNANRVKLVLVNAHSDNAWAEEEIRKLDLMATRWGLRKGEDYFLTSQLRKEWRAEVPHRVVRELLLMSNIFVFPSETECCSLVQAEAAITGKLLVLNSSFLPMFEFAHAWGFRFPFSDHDPEQDDYFYEKVSRNLMDACRRDPTFAIGTKARTEVYNRDWIWSEQLQPLLEDSHGNHGNGPA